MPDMVVEAARPKSVRLAEWTYLAAMALQLGVSAMIWDETVQVFGAGLAIADLAFTLGMVVLLLLLTTRRGSRGARIALAVLTGVTVAYRLWQFAVTEDAGTALLLLLVQAMVMLVGAVLLFRPDANAWFALPPEDDEEELA